MSECDAYIETFGSMNLSDNARDISAIPDAQLSNNVSIWMQSIITADFNTKSIHGTAVSLINFGSIVGVPAHTSINVLGTSLLK